MRRISGSRCLVAAAPIAALMALGCASNARPETSAVAPSDRPVGIADEQTLSELERLLHPCVLAARATYLEARRRFESGLPAGHTFAVVTKLLDDLGHSEVVFVAVERVEGDKAYGRIGNEIRSVRGFSMGDAVSVNEKDILDWVIVSSDGREDGNLLGKYMDNLLETGEAKPCVPGVR